jgi:YfiR/HmsC-like
MEKVKRLSDGGRRDRTFEIRPARKNWQVRVLALLRQMVTGVLCVAMVSTNLLCENQKPSEYQVEAAYLFNFGKFVNWPSEAAEKNTGSFVICVLGDDPFGTSLDQLMGHGTVKGKGLVAKRITRVQDAAACQVLYISSSEASRAAKIISTLGNTSVLTVSDIPQFIERGGMIQFILDGGKVRFQVNLSAAENAGLVMSSELLKVAVSVRRSAPQS